MRRYLWSSRRLAGELGVRTWLVLVGVAPFRSLEVIFNNWGLVRLVRKTEAKAGNHRLSPHILGRGTRGEVSWRPGLP